MRFHTLLRSPNVWRSLSLAVLFLLTSIVFAGTFFANLVASPDPNDGNFTLTFGNPSGPDDQYTIEEKPSGGVWTQLTFIWGGYNYAISGRTPGSYDYRIKWKKFNCFIRRGEEVCGPNGTDYSEEITVTVQTPGGSGSPGDPGDPYNPPGPFTVPDDADFPDATIITPSPLASDTGIGPNNYAVGALQGSGGVSGGQASYSIPIVVPPGRKGMQPSVSLKYSSSGGNGLVGVGWGLSATSSISRCSATAAQDGFTASVQYDVIRDRLCLDGQRLMVVSGTYGASGAEYRTELDSFARIRQYGTINSGTTYFEVEYKNNNKSWFGSTADSRHSAVGRSEVLTWAISELRDFSGNTISYDYKTGVGYDENAQHPIAAIHYTGYIGSDGDRHVKFEYQDRTDIRTSYMAGGKTRSTKRLSKITTEYQLTPIREYALDYGSASLSTSRSLLRSVEECAYKAGTKHCLPPTNFEWQESAPHYETEKLEFHNGVTWETKLADKRWLHEVVPSGDDDGDGVKDWPEWSANAEGQITSIFATSIANCFRKKNSFTLTCLEVDFDADGLTDSFRQSNDKLEVKRNISSTWVNTGINWSDNQSFAALADTPLGFADFNGDGWIDLAMKHDSQLYIYLHTKNVTAPYSITSRQLVVGYSLASGGLAHTFDIQVYGDMDGNGTADLVASNTQSGLSPGLPRPTTIYLTQSNAGGGLTITTRQITGLGVSSYVRAAFFHDLNGDGLADILRIDPSSEITAQTGVVQYRLNDGTDFVAGWTNLGMNMPMRYAGNYTSGPGETESYYEPLMSKMLVMDYDGDGRQEMLFAGTVVVSSCTEVQPIGYKCDDDLYGVYQSGLYDRLGTAMNSAILDDSIRQYSGIRFNENSAGAIITSSFPTDIIGSATQTAVIDATGDGLQDVVTVMGCRWASCNWNTTSVTTIGGNPIAEGAWINRNVGTATDVSGNNAFEFTANDMMSAVQNGFGVRNEWIYRPLSSDEYHKTGNEFYQTDHAATQTDYDYFHFASSMYVVAKYSASNGIGGLNDSLYRYRGAIYNNKGRGFQGFLAIETEEDVYADGHPLAGTDKISRAEFHQRWPKSSIVDTACTWLAADSISIIDPQTDPNPQCADVEFSNKLLSLTTTDAIHDIATSGGARFAAAKDQTSKSYDLANHSLLTTKVSTSLFDAAGNVTYQSSSHTDAWTTNFSETVTVYPPQDWTNWWLNKPLRIEVKHHPVSQRHVNSPDVDATAQDQLKVTETWFTAYDSTHRLPSTIDVNANDSALTQTVSTTYNLYGLPSQIEITGTDVTGPRTVDTTYSKGGTSEEADGYFPYTVTNALGHTVTLQTDPMHGQPTSQTDANGLVSVTSYDAFGRVVDTTPAGMPLAYQRFYWCNVGQGCPSGSAYSVLAVTAGVPEAITYFDILGRERQSSVESFSDLSVVSVGTEYDERGHVTFESQPYDLMVQGETGLLGTRYLGYDALGRLTSKESDQTVGQILLTTYTHSGFTTTINAAGISMERTYNGLGQLVETKDGNGGYTRYSYDGAGNPIVLADPRMIEMHLVDPNIIGIKASFNALGHKKWVEDPDWWDDLANDHGSKVFTYSGLGEVLSETDPEGNLIEMLYDSLGRLVQRKVNGELHAKWYFDNPDAHKGLGLLDLEDSQFRADGSRLQKFYYYSDATTGRKDLLQVAHRFYENDDPNDFVDYATQYFTDGFYARPKGLRYPGGTGLAYEYNINGYVTKEKDPTSSLIYREIAKRGSRNQITESNVANATGGVGGHKYVVTASYFSETGQAKTMSVSNGSTPYQTLSYTYEHFGNLDTRHTSVGGGTTEFFQYDDLQRLIKTERDYGAGIVVADTVDYGYDSAGSFLSKSDFAASYSYNSSRPHVVESAGNANYSHDQNGNVTGRDGDTVDYNAFNKPTHFGNASMDTSFTYGADLMRYKQITPQGSTILYIDKLMEIESSGSAVDFRHYLGDVAILTKTGDLGDPAPGIRYTFRDRLGGISMIGDETGLVTELRGYDAFGKPRASNWANKTPATINSNLTDRGFTDHEHLDDWQLIHMNGRGYDYNLGRFISMDPVIQDPGNSQSINAFAYIMNNPLSGTDPTGYCSTGSRLGVSVGNCRVSGTVQMSGSDQVEKVEIDHKTGEVTGTVDNGVGETYEVKYTPDGGNQDGSGTDNTNIASHTTKPDESENKNQDSPSPFDNSPAHKAIPKPIEWRGDTDSPSKDQLEQMRSMDESIAEFAGFLTILGDPELIELFNSQSTPVFNGKDRLTAAGTSKAGQMKCRLFGGPCQMTILNGFLAGDKFDRINLLAHEFVHMHPINRRMLEAMGFAKYIATYPDNDVEFQARDFGMSFAIRFVYGQSGADVPDLNNYEIWYKNHFEQGFSP